MLPIPDITFDERAQEEEGEYDLTERLFEKHSASIEEAS